MAIDGTTESTWDAEARDRAIKRLKKRRDFYGHLLAYALVNGFLVVIWAVTNVHAFFWPIFVILGWGIGLAFNAWDVLRNDTFSEQQIRREMEHMRRSG